jgi:Calx-beta domain-containing protein
MLIRLFKTRTTARSLCISIVFGLTCLLLPASALAQTPTVSISDTTVIEGDPGILSSAVFNLTLSAPSQAPVSILVSTQAGTATGDVDFIAGSVTVTFDPGHTTQTVTVFVKGDTVVEGTEQFFLNLSNPVNCTIADGQAIGTIVDDDGLILATEPNSQRAVALESVFFTRDPFSIHNDFNTSADHLTRVSLFAIGLKLAAGEDASVVTATAQDSQGTIRPVTVEFAGAPNFEGFTQVVLKLTDQLTTAGAGDLKIRITAHGETSNEVLVGVKP